MCFCWYIYCIYYLRIFPHLHTFWSLNVSCCEQWVVCSIKYRTRIVFNVTFLWRCDPTRVMASSITMFLDYTQRRTTDGRTPLDEWSARRKDLYLTIHNTQSDEQPCPGGIRTQDLSRRAAADLRLRRRGYWDRPTFQIIKQHIFVLSALNFRTGGVITVTLCAKCPCLFVAPFSIACKAYH
jgi:hypothetical protein